MNPFPLGSKNISCDRKIGPADDNFVKYCWWDRDLRKEGAKQVEVAQGSQID